MEAELDRLRKEVATAEQTAAKDQGMLIRAAEERMAVLDEVGGSISIAWHDLTPLSSCERFLRYRQITYKSIYHGAAPCRSQMMRRKLFVRCVAVFWFTNPNVN